MSPRRFGLAFSSMTDQERKRDRITGKVDGLLYNWDGKDYLWYKWTTLKLFGDHGLTDVLYKRVSESQLITEEGQQRLKYMETKIKRLIGKTLPKETLY